jgi:peptidoglycan/LPS O-acetylase OafA/YrhL
MAGLQIISDKVFKAEDRSVARPTIKLWDGRYDMLDGWRGLAALAVVVQHVFRVRIGHTAVMLFFVISGYCITASATSCLKKGYGFRQFMWRRIRRIYPPYLLAVGYFVVTRLIKFALTGSNPLNYPTEMWLQNVTLTQWFTLLHTQYAYAADNPANFVTAFWSLQYEEQFYLLIALMMLATFVFRKSMLQLALPLIVLAAGWNILFPYYSHGIFLEYWPHFAIGLLIFYRLCRVESLIARRTLDISLGVLAIGAAWYAWFVETNWYTKRPLAMELVTVAAFGLVIVYLRPFNERFKTAVAGKVLMKLGAISYSLYLIHLCNIKLVGEIASRLLPATWVWPSMIAQVGLHVVLAIPFYLLCERPFLNKSLVGTSRQGQSDSTSGAFVEGMGTPIGEVTP